MKRCFITTGPPGSGKSATLAILGGSVEVVREAATDVVSTLLEKGIRQPELDSSFLPRIVALQQRRRMAAAAAVQVHDRSVFCTVALARFLGRPEPPALGSEIEACAGWFEPTVFYFQPLGSITPTPVRRISYDDALRFGELHRAVYAEHGFDLIDVPAEPAEMRATSILRHISDGAS